MVFQNLGIRKVSKGATIVPIIVTLSPDKDN
jgi:hypothetical protein